MRSPSGEEQCSNITSKSWSNSQPPGIFTETLQHGCISVTPRSPGWVPWMLRGKNVPLLLLSSLPLQLTTSELPLHVRSPKDAPKPGQQQPTAERRNRINPQVTKSCMDHVTAHGRADAAAAQRKTHSHQHEGFSKDWIPLRLEG